jgi:hypothetical protein
VEKTLFFWGDQIYSGFAELILNQPHPPRIRWKIETGTWNSIQSYNCILHNPFIFSRFSATTSREVKINQISSLASA